jgi:predicted RNA-binding protein YlxR (DUF448 family)
MKTNHSPIRTCVGCGRKSPKEGLIRIVTVDGALSVDVAGKLPGRGAYLCPETACISSVLKRKGRLSYSLRASVSRAAEEAFLMGLLRKQDVEE